VKTFLSLIEPLLPAAQASRIAAIVATRRRAGQIATPQEVGLEITRLRQLLRGSRDFVPTFRVRVPTDPLQVMEGEDFNASMEELDFDLKTLFDVTNRLTGASLGLQKVLHSRLEALRAKICRLADDLLSYRRLKNTTGYARVITQGFADGRNDTVAGTPAQIDAQTRTLKLSTLSQRRHHQRRGINPARVVIRNLSAGLSGVASRTFKPENAIDPDPESFWADVLLTEAPISTTYTYLSGAEEVFSGALVEAELLLGSAEFVTDIRVLPFGEYPVRVVDVRLRQGQNEYQYPGFVEKDPSLNWLEWHGPRILADAVIFVLQQETYVRRRYHIPRSLLELTKFWEQLLDEEVRLTLDDTILTEFQEQRAVADARFASLQESMQRYGLELERLDLPAPDPDGRTIPEAEVLGREVEAVAQTLYSDPKEPSLQLRPLRDKPADTTQDEIVEIERVEYVFGARELQANDVDYLPEGYYSTPLFRPDSTLLKIQVDPLEEHVAFVDTVSYRRTSIEYEIEIAPGRRTPILPKGSTTVQEELLVLDRTTRQDTTRFAATSTTVAIRKNGALLSVTDYTVEMLATDQLRLTIAAAAFSRTARYSVTYTPVAGQDALDVEATYDSVALDRPEVFPRTDDQGSIELKFYPFVEFGIVNNETQFRREGTRSARWFWVGGTSQVFLDGRMYGDVNTTLGAALSAVATTILLSSAASVQQTNLPAKLQIGTEIVQYTGVSGSSLTGVTRGVDGTTAQAHPSGLQIVGERSYEPLIVLVGSVPAFNITDYLSGKHPAFLSTQDANLRYEFLHIGNRLYFSRPVLDKPITVVYRWMSQWIQVHALLRSHAVGRVPFTPILRRMHIETESTVL
jgi:hypothetical protein